MKVVLGADVDGKELKDYIKNYLLENGYDVIDKSEDKDFVDTTCAVAKEVLSDEYCCEQCLSEDGLLSWCSWHS